MDNLLVILLIVVILGTAAAYVYKAKKSGQQCIGCPHSKSCSGGCHCNNSK